MLCVAWLIVTQTPVSRAILLPQIERQLGLRVQAARISVGLDGVVTIRDGVFTIPGVPGEAGEVLRVERLVARPEVGSLLAGSPRLESVEIRSPVVRLSQSAETGALNLASIVLLRTGAPGGLIGLPTLNATDATIEFGEHARDGSFTRLRAVLVDGRLYPERDDQGRPGYAVELREHRIEGAERPIAITGRFDAGGITLEMDELALRDWTPDAVPSAYRTVYESLALEGEIARTSFSLIFPAEIVARIDLADVAITLPFALDADEPGAERARMRRVRGRIEFERDRVKADLSGLLEDLPYAVELTYEGTDADAPFIAQLHTRDYELGRDPGLLPFAPELVRRRLASFDNPTGVIDSTVFVSRGRAEAGSPAPIDVRGWIEFRNARASYEHFPYPFESMSGLVLFDPDKIEVSNIVGTGPTGASLRANALIAPPDGGAEVWIDIRVQPVPVDEYLSRALGPQRSEVIEELFSRRADAELRARGLVIGRAEAETLRGRLAELDALLTRPRRPDAMAPLLAERGAVLQRLEAPMFDLGSTGAVDVRLRREPGVVSVWRADVDVQLDRAGLLPDQFPLPILGEDVSLRIGGGKAELLGGVFRGLTGGSAEIDAIIDIPLNDDDDTPVTPNIRIRAEGVPIDERLLLAIPDPAADDAPEGEQSPASIRRMLRELRLVGDVGCEARVLRREDGTLGFDVDVRVPALRARPAPTPGEAASLAVDLAGRVAVNERTLVVELEGEAHAIAHDAPPAPAGRLGVRTDVRFELPERPDRAHDPGFLEVFVEGDGTDLAARFEDLARVFSREAADAITGARTLYQPTGVAHGAVRVAGALDAVPRVEAAFTRLLDVEIELLEGRAALTSEGGVVVVDVGPDEPPIARLDALVGPLLYNREPAGRVHLDGTLAIAPRPRPEPGRPELAEPKLLITLEGGDFASGLARGSIASGDNPELLDLYDRHQPRGPYRVALELRPEPTRLGETPTDEPPALLVFGTLHPGAITFDRPGGTVHLEPIEGLIRFAPGEARFEGLRLTAPTWIATCDGEWLTGEDGSAEATLRFGLRSLGVADDLRSILPHELIELIEALEIRADGPVAVEDGTVHLARGATPVGGVAREPRTVTTGLVRAGGVGLSMGLPIADADVALRFSVERDPAQEIVRWSMDVLADRLRYGGVEMRRARALISGGADREGPLPTLIPVATADCHGGRVSVSAMSETRPDGRVQVEGEVRAADVRFASVLEDLRREAERTAEREGEGDKDAPEARVRELVGVLPPPAPDLPPDESRGRLDAELGFRAIADEPETVSARGVIRVFGGRILSLPLAVRLIELSNFRLPMNEPIDFAQADFYLRDGRLVFEDLSAFSRSVRILGFGTVTWPELEMDLMFNSRAEARIPIISAVFENLRDELASTRVTGTPDEPSFELMQFPQTRRLLSQFFGVRESSRSRRLAELKERAEAARARAGRGVRVDRAIPAEAGGQQ